MRHRHDTRHFSRHTNPAFSVDYPDRKLHPEDNTLNPLNGTDLMLYYT